MSTLLDTTALVLAFILGLTASSTPGVFMKGFLTDFRDIVTRVITRVIRSVYRCVIRCVYTRPFLF